MTMDEQGQPLRVPLVWQFPSDIVTRYATNIVVQHTEHEFVISFFEAQPPPVLGDPEEQEAIVESMLNDGVPATCVARVVVASERFQTFVEVLQTNLDRYIKKVAGE